ncbi:Ldh family oxidoreductase [Serratia entomophila]|uniref:Ldh family oxidoreductase n=1 Tax=Serratia entomophila TaxID=42906 RepID=UPI00217BDAC1|nr:Ldh family oxidoreductase [Serratia entomophila]CAI1039869.1 Ureidoglycolate dehydrogenase [Serratia entomophila]CAI1041571.1 Ureidoglycolate dehydrogenase [Serratia entomophila]CAI1869107.1 Ureidoglycolate dehydrogenase [Serratia entomophila]CAI1876020.1 Ureidoglycolate dehydrogenase [Serratia entomophila]CAI1880680.1 Ureidoglycolate dehydrogenase [Serratia entomophila]
MPKVVSAEELKAFVSAVFQAFGVPEKDALMLSDSLVTAELWGHSSHGMLRLPWYIARLRHGAMAPEDVSFIATDSGSLVVIDGNHSMGQVMAMKAIDMGMARARQHGISAVAVRNSNHFGTAAYFTRQVAESGFIALLATNASAAMAPWGGSQKLIGTNPWSIAAPAGKRGVVVMDIANTAVARGKIYLAAERNEAIPDSWAADVHGVPTTLASEAVHGLLLPMAGHKGYAIAFMMDILAGVLTGSQFGKGVAGPYDATQKSGCGHLLITIDIAGMMANDEFNVRINELIDQVKAIPTAKGVAEIFFPGEIEDRHAAENVKNGIAIADNTWQSLVRLSEEAAVVLPTPIQSVAQ